MNQNKKNYQSRYRLKQELLKKAEKLFRRWQLGQADISSRSPREVKASLDAIIKLPRNWTEEDYRQVKDDLIKFETNLLYEDNLDLQKNIYISRKEENPGQKKSRRLKAATAAERATRKMKKAYTVIVGALELAETKPEDEAAALLEVMRFVARKLAKVNDISENDATAFCLSTLSNSYTKPAWVKERMTKFLEANCHETNIIHREI